MCAKQPCRFLQYRQLQRQRSRLQVPVLGGFVRVGSFISAFPPPTVFGCCDFLKYIHSPTDKWKRIVSRSALVCNTLLGVLPGRSNAGKSTLLNQLTQKPIVSIYIYLVQSNTVASKSCTVGLSCAVLTQEVLVMSCKRLRFQTNQARPRS